MPTMQSTVHHDEILQSVVIASPVEVMHPFGWQQAAAQGPHDDSAVFQHGAICPRKRIRVTDVQADVSGVQSFALASQCAGHGRHRANTFDNCQQGLNGAINIQ